jgi:dihydrofolate reductase
MNTLVLVAAVAKNNVIGKNGKTPWHISEEMTLFKAATMGSPVIVGRKTYEDIGHPLPGRRTIVLSHTLPILSSPELIICHSIPQAIQEVQSAKTAFVIGGQQIYAQMMPFADELLISHLQEAYEGDSWFPEIDTNLWKEVERQEFPRFTHSRYQRI